MIHIPENRQPIKRMGEQQQSKSTSKNILASFKDQIKGLLSTLSTTKSEPSLKKTFEKMVSESKKLPRGEGLPVEKIIDRFKDTKITDIGKYLQKKGGVFGPALSREMKGTWMSGELNKIDSDPPTPIHMDDKKELLSFCDNLQKLKGFKNMGERSYIAVVIISDRIKNAPTIPNTSAETHLGTTQPEPEFSAERTVKKLSQLVPRDIRRNIENMNQEEAEKTLERFKTKCKQRDKTEDLRNTNQYDRLTIELLSKKAGKKTTVLPSVFHAGFITGTGNKETSGYSGNLNNVKQLLGCLSKEQKKDIVTYLEKNLPSGTQEQFYHITTGEVYKEGAITPEMWTEGSRGDPEAFDELLHNQQPFGIQKFRIPE